MIFSDRAPLARAESALEIDHHFLYDVLMNKKKHSLLHLLIAAIAIINLGLLFVFQYGLSGATPAVQAAERASEERAAYDAATGFDTRQSAAERGALIVTAGESDPAAQAGSTPSPAPESSVSSAEAGDSSSAEADLKSSGSEEASADSSESSSADGNSPKPEKEKGDPSLKLDDSSLPEISYKDLPKLATILTDLEMLSAEDAYGNDISNRIRVEYEPTDSNTLEFNVTFSVDVPGGKTLTEEKKITVTSDVPVLELTKEKVTLKVNENFDYMNYVKVARDVNGNRLGDYVSLSGFVDTYTPGTYELTYSLTSWVNSQTVQQKLTVVVE